MLVCFQPTSLVGAWRMLGHRYIAHNTHNNTLCCWVKHAQRGTTTTAHHPPPAPPARPTHRNSQRSAGLPPSTAATNSGVALRLPANNIITAGWLHMTPRWLPTQAAMSAAAVVQGCHRCTSWRETGPAGPSQQSVLWGQDTGGTSEEE